MNLTNAVLYSNLWKMLLYNRFKSTLEKLISYSWICSYLAVLMTQIRPDMFIGTGMNAECC